MNSTKTNSIASAVDSKIGEDTNSSEQQRPAREERGGIHDRSHPSIAPLRY